MSHVTCSIKVRYISFSMLQVDHLLQMKINHANNCNFVILVSAVGHLTFAYRNSTLLFMSLRLNLCLLMSFADNLCKQFGPRSGPTESRACSGSNVFATLMVFLKEFFKNVNFHKKSADDKKACQITQHSKSCYRCSVVCIVFLWSTFFQFCNMDI